MFLVELRNYHNGLENWSKREGGGGGQMKNKSLKHLYEIGQYIKTIKSHVSMTVNAVHLLLR